MARNLEMYGVGRVTQKRKHSKVLQSVGVARIPYVGTKLVDNAENVSRFD